MANTEHDEIDRLYGLLIELRADSLSEEHRTELNHMLQESPALRTVAADFLMDEASLIHELRTNECRDLFQDSGMAAGMSSELLAFSSSASPSSRTEKSGSLTSRSRAKWYAVICVATALGFAWGLLTRNVSDSQTKDVDGDVAADWKPEPQKPVVCATLTLDSQCEWETPLSLGDHFHAGRYTLNRGVAGLHLTDGSKLYFEGPAGFEIRTSRHVILTSGRVLAEVSEEAVGFRLETPTTSVVDVGTAFEVSVDSGGASELEVIEGAVTLLPSDSSIGVNPPLIFSGDVRRIDGTDSSVTGKSPKDGFRKRLDTLLESQAKEELIAFEGFDGNDSDDAYIRSGHGWKTPWLRGWFGEDPASVVVRKGRNIDAPIWLPEPSESYVVCPTGSVSRRLLEHPIDTTLEQTYYLSFLLRRRAVSNVNQRESGSGLRLSHVDERDTGCGVCIDWRQHLTTWSGDQRWRGELEMENDRSFLIVLRISCHQDEPDRVHAISFPADSLPLVVAPDEWHSYCKPHHMDEPLGMISLWSGQSAVSLVDEIRVGTSWRSVVPVR